MRRRIVISSALLLVSTSAEAQIQTSLQKPQGIELCTGMKCIGHLASKSEIEQILAHPLFNAFSPATFDKIKERRAAVAKREGVLIGMFGLTLAPQIRYENFDAFMAAQSADRRQNLPPRLPKIRQTADDLFSSALREYLDQRSARSADKGAAFQAAIRRFLGPHMLECWRRPAERKSQSVDAGGMLHVQSQTVNDVTQSCFETIQEDRKRFIDLIQVREWHPYLWENMSKTYAYLRRFLTPDERAKLSPIPQPLLVDQDAFATVTGVGQRAQDEASEVVTPPAPKNGSRILASEDDYPPSAVRNGEQGTVHVRLTIGITGVIEQVQLLRSSGSNALDEATLAIIRRRYTRVRMFEPARDEGGYPVRGTFDERITWSLPR